MPKHGSIDTLFDRLRVYISEVDKNWINNIKPANRESIEKLKRYSRIEEKGFDVPNAYRIFLEHMGEDDDGFLDRYLLATVLLSYMLEYYEETQRLNPEEINPNLLCFGIFDWGEECAFDLRQAGEPAIVEADGYEIFRTRFESFEKLLFQAAFTKCERIRFPFYADFGGSALMLKEALEKCQTEDIIEVINEIAEKEGFTKAWFSDFRQYIGYRDDMVFDVVKGQGVAFAVHGNCEREALTFAEVASNIGTHGPK